MTRKSLCQALPALAVWSLLGGVTSAIAAGSLSPQSDQWFELWMITLGGAFTFASVWVGASLALGHDRRLRADERRVEAIDRTTAGLRGLIAALDDIGTETVLEAHTGDSMLGVMVNSRAKARHDEREELAERRRDFNNLIQEHRRELPSELVDQALRFHLHVGLVIASMDTISARFGIEKVKKAILDIWDERRALRKSLGDVLLMLYAVRDDAGAPVSPPSLDRLRKIEARFPDLFDGLDDPIER